MIEVVFQGRGGQGVWTCSEILASAALIEGKYVQSFPMFGPERIGGLVTSFTRIDDKPIKIRSFIYNTDALVILDQRMVEPQYFVNVNHKTTLVVNSAENPSKIKEKIKIGRQVWTLDASNMSIRAVGKVIVNTPMLGVLVRASSIVSLDSVLKAVKTRFKGEVGEQNVLLVRKAYEEALSS